MQKEMIRVSGRAAEAALEKLKERFEQWRRGRESRGPIPRELLKEARELVGPFYAATVAKTLGLHYRHVGKVKGHSVVATRGVAPVASPTSKKPLGPTFVRVPLEPREPTTGMGPGVVEFENPRGYKARIYVGGDPTGLAHELIRAISGESR